MKSELKLEGVRKRIGDFVLVANFSIQEGERAVLTGKSGIGKTTLLRLIAGLESLIASHGDTGRIVLGEGQDITFLQPEKRKVGFVFQEPTLFPSLNVLDNAIFGLMQKGEFSRQQARDQGLTWLEKVGMKELANASVGRLSGGEAQRLAFIRALIWRPSVMLLDEPFSALDPETRATLRSELVRLHELHPVPMLLVSHDPQDREAIATVGLELRREADTNVRSVVRH